MNGEENQTSEPAAGAAGAPESAPGASAEAAPERVYTEAELKAATEAAAAAANDRHLRVVAEYDNYRRRVQKEKEQWASEAIERFAGDLLLVLDDFDRALAVKSDSAAAVLDGIRLTDKQLRSVLSRHGVECIDPAGAKFDPKLHEAIQRVPAGDKQPGTVVTVFEKGYTLKGKLIRPARVQVTGDA